MRPYEIERDKALHNLQYFKNSKRLGLKMKVIDLAPLKISDAYYGAGPGCGGIMEFVISLTDGVFCVKYNVDTTEPSEEWHTLTGIDENADWRSIFKPMEHEGVASLDIEDGTPPSAFEVTGELNFANELVVCACTGGQTLRLVHELLQLDDYALAELRLKYSSLLNDEFLSQLLELMEKVDETSLSLSALLMRCPDLHDAERDFEQFLLVEEAEKEADRLRKEWALRPFQEQIDNIIESWKKDNPETSMNQSFGIRAMAYSIQRYIKNYVASNYQLPKGIHEFDVNIFKNKRLAKIDFDKLHESKSET